MPFRLFYDKEKKILHCYYEGPFSFEEFELLLQTLVSGKEYPSDANMLWRLRNIDSSAVNAEFMERTISIRRKFPERRNARVAILASGELGFGLGRMYESYSEIAGMPQNICVFRNLTDAEDWLMAD